MGTGPVIGKNWTPLILMGFTPDAVGSVAGVGGVGVTGEGVAGVGVGVGVAVDLVCTV